MKILYNNLHTIIFHRKHWCLLSQVMWWS